MPNLQAISRTRHGTQRWRGEASYVFAANDAVTLLTAAELPKATMSLTIAFIEQAGCFVPVAVLGLQPGKNLFVAPDGRWLGPYIPAAFRAYPFMLANTEDGQRVLCIDEDSGRIGDGPAGESFFTEDGQATPALMEISNFLQQIEQNRLSTTIACASLQKHELIRPWPITWKNEGGEEQITGLFQIDEAALNRLPNETLLEVREAGALPLAYCQLLSMQHLPELGKLAEAHAQAAAQVRAQKAAPRGNPNLEFLNNGGTISFKNLK